MSGPAADWSRAPERSNMLALRIICWIALTCGRRVARWVLHPISLYFLLFSPGPRRHIKRYLSRAVGRHHTWRDGYRLIHAFASTALDRVYFLRGRVDLLEVRIHGVSALEAEAAQGRGALLLGAHVGSFEVISACRQQVNLPERLR
ncbi:MAG: acyl-CoA synthetase, partial [Burkholderiaceae bacterium]|nr:acyl-CoA synthetase [Burkholderiaceae bacterium]